MIRKMIRNKKSPSGRTFSLGLASIFDHLLILYLGYIFPPLSRRDFFSILGERKKFY